jgi:hypothetical protein
MKSTRLERKIKKFRVKISKEKMKMKKVDFFSFMSLNPIFTHQRPTIGKSCVSKYQVLMLTISEDINSF